VCIDWQLIAIAIIVSNFLQVLFQTSLARSIELTYKPTYLDKMQDPELFEKAQEQANNPDQKVEPKCSIVMSKCCGEMLAITLYFTMVMLMLIGILHNAKDGKPLTGLIEFGIAIIIDQLKSIPVQFFVWWTVIRRCGKFETQDFDTWDDDHILHGGQEPSLFSSMRTSVKHFLENKYISQLILVMTLFLCFIIFTELAMPSEDYMSDPITLEYTTLGMIYYVINYFLLTFFVLEIILKLFSYGHIFLLSFINVFDSIVVLISFVFHILDVKVKFVGLLRILRLIKVITEMKRQSDEKKAKKEAIKKQKKASSQMASYVERIIDFLEKQAEHPDMPKMLREDIEWAIDVISANKLYTGSLDTINYNLQRPEIAAWLNQIKLK
jgi:hypothetical protein